MKKSNLFLVMMMALIVMSCSKDETTMSIPQESNAITFGTYVGRDAKTRATALNLVGLQTSGFGVFAFYSDEEANKYVSGTPSNFIPNFMYNTKVSGESWTYAPIKYWPNEANDKLTFFAYAPYSDGTEGNNITDFTGNAVTGDPTLTFTVNSTATAQSDLLYADAGSLKNLTKQTTTGTVNFPFKHALSRIGFNVEVMSDQVNEDVTGTDDDGTTVISDAIADGTVVSVEKVELIGKFVSSNTFNFATGEWTGTATTVSPVDPAYSLGVANFEAVATTGVTTAKAKLNLDGSYLMVIPKVFTSTPTEGLKIRVTYKVKTTDAALNDGHSEVTNVITSSEFAFTFVAGKAYLFNLHLGLTSVKFSATMTDWSNAETETVVNVPLNL